MKVYKDYKEIEIKNIKGARVDLYNESIISKVNRERDRIKMRGFKRPFDVVERENEYYLIGDRISFIAAKTLGYDKIPCLIRDIEKEILLRKLCKILGLDGEEYEMKRKEKRLNYCREKYYKLNACDGIVSYLLDTLVTILIVMTFKTTISLGFLTTVFAICSIVSIYIYQNKIKNKSNIFSKMKLLSRKISVISTIPEFIYRAR